MWMIGVIVGALIGAALAGGEGALLGSIGGGALVAALRRKTEVDPQLEERLQALEGRVARLAHTLDTLMAQPRSAAVADNAVAVPDDESAPAAALTPTEQFVRDAVGETSGAPASA